MGIQMLIFLTNRLFSSEVRDQFPILFPPYLAPWVCHQGRQNNCLCNNFSPERFPLENKNGNSTRASSIWSKIQQPSVSPSVNFAFAWQSLLLLAAQSRLMFRGPSNPIQSTYSFEHFVYRRLKAPRSLHTYMKVSQNLSPKKCPKKRMKVDENIRSATCISDAVISR